MSCWKSYGKELMSKMTKIKSERIRLGVTQEQFSEMTGIPRRTIQSWEEGIRKPPEYVERLLLESLHRGQGQWKEVVVNGVGYHKECSICGARWMLDSQEHICKETAYCYNCGANMQKEG